MHSKLDFLEATMLLETEGRIWAVRQELLPLLASGRLVMEDEEALKFLGISAEERDRIMARQVARVSPGGDDGGAVATIPLKGVLMPQVSLLAQLFGLGSSLASFRSDLNQAASNPDISQIVLDIDSPGGLVDQIPETAAEIRQAASKKPVTAVANTLAASAAYWLGSQATEFVVTPSGEAGSIGVYSVHKDLSEAHAQAGVKPTIISAGKRKTEGNPYEPLSSDAADGIQEAVNDYYSMFTRDVARGRGASAADVREGFGEGRTLTARRAVAAGLADRVDTLQGAVARAAKGEVQKTTRADVEYEEQEEREESYSSEERGRVLETLVALGLDN